MTGPMDMVDLRIDKSLPDKATLVLLVMIKVMSTPHLLAIGAVRNMRVGAWPIDMVAMGVVRVVI